MWEAVKSFGTNPISLVALFLIIGIVIILLRKGLFSYNGHGVQIGKIRDNERTIIVNQCDYARNACYAIMSDLPKDIDVYKAKYIIEQVINRIEDAIHYNHITDKESYLQLKKDICWNEVSKRATNDFIKSDAFHKMCDDTVEKVFKNIIQIRKEFE